MKMTLIRCGAVAGTCLAAAVAFGVTEWPLERLQLAAGYFDGPAVRTEQNVREMREAGIDLLIHSRNGDTNTFALLEKYGIRTVLNDLCDNIVMGPDKVGRQHELYPPAWYARQAKRFVDAPAIVGIDAGDEPSALDFPYLGEVIGQVSELFPGKYPYFNIYPNYASLSGLSGSVVKSQLGTATYEEHVAAYLKHMPLNYICFDHYLYPRKPEDETAMVNRYHDNFRVVSDACRASGRQLCFWAQVSTPPWKIEFGYTRTNQMRYQAFTALAYGARMICWGCYAGGWWTNRVLTATGEKTVLYDRLKTVNHEVRRLQSAYDRLRWLGTTRVRGRFLDAGCFRDVGTEDGAELVVGEFTGRSPDDPARGLLVVAGNDPLDLGRSDVTVRLKCETAVRVFGPEGEMSVDPDASGVLRLRMKPNACALFVTRRTAAEDGEDVVRFDLSGRKADDGLFEDLATVSSNCVRTGRRLLCRRNASGDLSVVEKTVLALGGDFERTEGEKTLVTMLRDFRPTASSFVPSFSNGYFIDLKAEDGTRLVVGDRVAKDEFARRRALVVFAAGDGSETGRKMHRITFRVRGQISGFGSQGPFACPPDANGLRSLRLADGELAVILLQNGKAACARMR